MITAETLSNLRCSEGMYSPHARSRNGFADGKILLSRKIVYRYNSAVLPHHIFVRLSGRTFLMDNGECIIVLTACECDRYHLDGYGSTELNRFSLKHGLSVSSPRFAVVD